MEQQTEGRTLPVQGEKLTKSQQRICGYISFYGLGGCCEAKRAIAGKLHMSVKTVERALQLLRERGLIVSVARFADDGSQLSNTYYATSKGIAIVNSFNEALA